jgi:hypothetical protein
LFIGLPSEEKVENKDNFMYMYTEGGGGVREE